MPPESVGPYRIDRALGEGAFGAVFHATHEETGCESAVKMLHAAAALQPEIQNRFVREIAILQRLDHDNIVRHYDCGLHDGYIYCSMELIDSGTVRDLISGGKRLPWREAAKIAAQVARGLAHAHANGCVHRDLKPANLYISADGMVKIGDLGLARDLDGTRLTIEGHTVGTWRYMAPEQIYGRDDIDGRLDLYALGCILFRMLTGKVPFDGEDSAEIFDQHLEAPRPRVDEMVPSVSMDLVDLVEWLMQVKPDDRPGEAAVVAARLESILDGATASDDRISIKSTLVGDIIDLGEDEQTASYSPLRSESRKPRSSTSLLKWSLLAVLLLIAAVALFIAVR